MKRLLLVCVLYITCLIVLVRSQTGKSEYEQLTTAIFTGYDKRIRPTVTGGATTVEMMFEPLSIIDLDENSQVLSTFGRLHCQWYDEVLSWDPNNASGIQDFMWPQDDVWLPDIVITNSIEEEKRPGYKEMPVKISYTGVVTWVPAFIFKTSCDMDVTYYPFDTQTCNIVISAKMSTYRDIQVRSYSGGGATNGVTWEAYSPGGSWDLQSIGIQALTNSGDVTQFQFTLKLKRMRSYYILNIIIPVLFLSLTASLVFYLPADAGEKIGMSMTVLLAYAVYLTIIADNMPKTSMQVSLLAVYLTLLLAVTALGVVMSVVVLNLHHTTDELPVGRRTEVFARTVRHYLRLGYHPKVLTNKVRPDVRSPATTLTDADFLSNSGPQQNHQSPPCDTEHPSSTKKAVQIGRTESWVAGFGSNVSSCETNNPDERETITWPKVAEAVDRLMFLVFTCFVFLVTIILLPYMALRA